LGLPYLLPGADSHYSIEGYFLLAMILEKVSEVYARFLQKNIFDPLKLFNPGSVCKDLRPIRMPANTCQETSRIA
jgi:CubicO group peptidase (beta-lactamase class C family)